MFQTRLRNVEEPAQLTQDLLSVLPCNSEGIFRRCCFVGFHHPDSLDKHDPSRTCFVIVFVYDTYSYYTAKKKYCQYIFEKREEDEDMIKRDIVKTDIIKQDIIIWAHF